MYLLSAHPPLRPTAPLPLAHRWHTIASVLLLHLIVIGWLLHTPQWSAHAPVPIRTGTSLIVIPMTLSATTNTPTSPTHATRMPPIAPINTTSLIPMVSLPNMTTWTVPAYNASQSTPQERLTSPATVTSPANANPHDTASLLQDEKSRSANQQPNLTLPISDADYLRNPAPVYPRLSRQLGEQGTVVLHVLISAEGRPEKIELRTSSGFSRLDEAALAVMPRWRFIPGTRQGIPEAMWFNIPLRFVLD